MAVIIEHDDDNGREKCGRDVATLVYILQAVGFFTGITFLAGIIVNYVKIDDVRGTFVESHFRWQMRTFWFGLLWSVVGWITFILIIGWFILALDYIWVLYRVIKGWLALREGRPVGLAGQ